MDTVAIAAVTGVVTDGLTKLGASAGVMKYWSMLSAALPHLIPAAEDAYAFLTGEVSTLWDMLHGGKDPTDDQWAKLDGHVISVLNRLNAQASPGAQVKA